ncbi:hypothetical protein ACFYYS_06175 [Streptomyces sp. NPDC002120]|uniref:hypothetical protein n=1 Tax=Streptomyces sp. NPDC002120 TaxID=3364631 RepID=UPI00369C1978
MIFDDAPVEVLVYPVVLGEDGYGGTAPREGVPVPVRAFVQPMELGEVQSGDASPVRYKLLMKAAPAKKWSRVDIDGQAHYTVYPPRLHRASPDTTFVSAIVEGAELYG